MFGLGFLIGAVGRWLYGFGPTSHGGDAVISIIFTGVLVGLLASVLL